MKRITLALTPIIAISIIGSLLWSMSASAQTPIFVASDKTGSPAILCKYWLNNNRARLNDPAGPGGRDPITQVSGPNATWGSFGANDVSCRLTLLHASGTQEAGWLILNPLQWWIPPANNE